MLKLSRFGGISRIRLARDVCRQWGLSVTMEDSGGGDIVTAAMAHLAASTPAKSLLNGMLINMLVNEHIAEGAPEPKRRLGGGVTPSRPRDHRGREGARAPLQHPLSRSSTPRHGTEALAGVHRPPAPPSHHMVAVPFRPSIPLSPSIRPVARVVRAAAFRHPDLCACTLRRWHASYSNRTS